MKSKVCERCGREFGCSAEDGKCWCANLAPTQLPAGAFKDCLCAECLRAVALHEGEDYYFDNGLMVFTRAYHLKRGSCCRRGCRHCPYL